MFLEASFVRRRVRRQFVFLVGRGKPAVNNSRSFNDVQVLCRSRVVKFGVEVVSAVTQKRGAWRRGCKSVIVDINASTNCLLRCKRHAVLHVCFFVVVNVRKRALVAADNAVRVDNPRGGVEGAAAHRHADGAAGQRKRFAQTRKHALNIHVTFFQHGQDFWIKISSLCQRPVTPRANRCLLFWIRVESLGVVVSGSHCSAAIFKSY